MASKFFDIDCGDDEPAVLEIVKPAKQVPSDKSQAVFWQPVELRWHNWDLETELAAQELGFFPSRCYVVHMILTHADFAPTNLLRKALHPATDYFVKKSVSPDFPGWIEILLAAGADSDALTEEDEPVLAVAALFGNIEAVEALIAAGADVAAQENVAIRWAAAGGNYNIVNMLVEAGADPQMGLPDAAAGAHVHIIELLVDAGAVVDDKALKAAIDYGHPDVVDLLQELRK